ncbi:MAG: bifunctional phosphopantothenoylcysteine decarboxylase/phosphopantothenate synthase [Alphaproteobacteria bacterium]|nr:bifunctional phosphopantothenoylcysteine decarboxylase/phosphopantothenate synthase [Alphaproteobacteria bacterium]
MNGPRVLLVVGGGIAAYKSCELIRVIRKSGGEVTCVLTEGGAKFVTPMALAALSENPVYTSLFDLKDEVEMGHIQLSREADIVVVCPATANLMAKMASGIADDLATTVLLATDKPVMAVPAMNVRMWQHEVTQHNVEMLRAAGVDVMDPDEGAMACGEYGPGRLPEPVAVWQRIAWALDINPGEIDLTLPPPKVIEYHPGGVAPVVEGEPDVYGPEDEAPAKEESGLGGLSTSLISRGIQKAKEAVGLATPMPAPEPLAPVVGGPILSQNGKARAAPPTDPEAINHVVRREEDFAPQPFNSEVPSQFPSVGNAMAPAQRFTVDPDYQPLAGKHVLVTAGPTREPIDPVRYIANRSSGKQGFAIAGAAAVLGARVTLVAGPVHLTTPWGVERIDVETAVEMAEAVKEALPADIGVMVAAVADWRVDKVADEKIKKRGSAPPALLLTENPDILATVAGSRQRPKLLVGFAAETEDVLRHATEKRKRKRADWIVVNDVSGDVMGGELNRVHIVRAQDIEDLPEMLKEQVAMALVERMAQALSGETLNA